MNKIFLFTFVLILMTFSSDIIAQENRDSNRQGGRFDREAFQARRNAFITAEMGLTPEEAAAFIPLADELRNRVFEVGQDCRKYLRESLRKKDLSDADYLKVIDECLDVKLKEAQIEREYYEQFKKILPPTKLIKYQNAENQFARHFMMEGERVSREGNRENSPRR